MNSETQKKLEEIGKKMNEQEHRSTHMPLFVIQYEDKVLCPDDFGDEALILNEEGEEVQDKELCKKCREELSYHGVMHHTITCDECGEHRVYCYTLEDKFDLQHGVFLTADACDEYIKRRSYEMKYRARSYAISAYWSTEMQHVLQFLSVMGSSDGKPHTNYTM